MPGTRFANTAWFATLLLALFYEAASPVSVAACNVPVFRYALERWAADCYELVVFYKGRLDPESAKLVDALQEYVGKPTGSFTNLIMEVVDVNGKMDPELEKMLKTQENPVFPWMVLRYPTLADINANLYSGPLDGSRLRPWLDSPARRALSEKLMRGVTAVWLMVDSGNQAKDEEQARWLAQTLAKLEKDLKLPELTDSPKDKLRIDVPLKIEFALLRVSRQDPAETELVRMLLGMEEDLATRTEVMVFPVFGRGMALWAILGKGITTENITRAASFIVAPCSCEIKSQNPGVDLLLTAAWEDRLTDRITTTPELPRLMSLISERPTTSQALRKSAPSSSVIPVNRNYALWRNIILALGAGLVLLILASMLVFARKKDNNCSRKL